ncbi:MAG TPA: hypothetical protein VE987_17125 [Polyangiaceae bacterium]|nr:hypothetical protein [Polyangiaceae bacterium]
MRISVWAAVVACLAACSDSSTPGENSTAEAGGPDATAESDAGARSDAAAPDATSGGDGGATNDGPGGGADATGPSDSATASDGSGADGPTDGSVADGEAPPVGDGAALVCGAAACTGADTCCLTPTDAGLQPQCLASCPDGGGSVQCAGPENCAAGAPLCCGTLTTGAGTPPNCPVTMVQTRCGATCNASLALTCATTEQARLCHRAADCAGDPANPTCCQFAADGGGASFTICVSSTLVGLTGCAVQP